MESKTTCRHGRQRRRLGLLALGALALAVLLLTGRFSSQAQAQEPGGIIHPDVMAALQESPEVRVVIGLAGLALPPPDKFNDVTFAEYQQQLAAVQGRVLAKLTPADFTSVIRYTVSAALAGYITESGVEKLSGHPDIRIVALDIKLFPQPKQPPAAPLGDANCDSTVNSIDAVLVLQLDAALIQSLPCEGSADVSGDGETDARDAAVILQIEAGLCCE